MKLFFLVFVLMTSSFTYAETDKGGFFLEPSFTYEQGSSKIEYPDPLDNSSGDIDGFGAGLRLGFHVYESLFIGADGRYSLPRFQDSTLDQDVRAKAYNYGPVIGLQMPTDLGLRVWGSYILGAELDPDEDQDVDEKFKDGNGYRLGGGIKLGVVSLNLEYQYIKYDETELQDAGPFTGDSDDINLKNHSWIVSVSFPVSF